MNMHVPQTQQARAEVWSLMSMPHNILTAQTNDPICGPVQDALYGSYLMTRRGEFTQYITLEQFCDLLMYIETLNYQDFLRRLHIHFPEYVEKRDDHCSLNKYHIMKHKIPAYIAWSACFPGDFYFESNDVLIKNGILLKGEMAKRHIGPHGVVLDKIAKYSGVWNSAEWMSDVENVTNIWLSYSGFSIGIEDFFTSNDSEILKTLHDINLKYDVIRDDATKSERDREQAILGTLNSAISVGERLASQGMNKGADNALNICIKSKAKGSFMNITQTAAALGQQNVNGGRIPRMLNNGKRCLAYFQEEDDSPAARGFVSSNLIDGLSLPEAQFHAFGGREGLIDTACKTKETGYFQRSLTKTNEDLVVVNNRTVSSYGHIVQFAYGGDNFDGSQLSKVKFPDGTIKLFFCDPAYIASTLKTMYTTESLLLTQEQIDKLLAIITHPLMNQNVDFVEQMIFNIRNKFYHLLNNITIPTGSFGNFHEMCEKMFNKAVVNVGENVGIIAGSCIGEMTTQSTLNTFHSSGTLHKAVTQGIPRLKELKDSTKKPKSRSAKINIKKDLFPEKLDNICDATLFFESFNKKIKHITLENLLTSSTIERFMELGFPSRDPTGLLPIPFSEDEEWVSDYLENALYEDDPVFTQDAHCGFRIRLRFDRQKVYESQTDMFEISDAIHTALAGVVPFFIVPSPYAESTILVYVAMQGLRFDEQDIQMFDDDDVPYVVLRDIITPNIKSVSIGINTGVSNIYTEESDKECPLHEKFFITTEGGDYENILSLDCIDPYTCVIDDFWQVYHALDIEAAKKCLSEEFYKALTGDGSYIDRRLVDLTVDNMCRRGTIDSMRRDSVPMDVTGPIQKIAFEKPIHYIVTGASSGSVDPCTGASGAICTGNNPMVGTEFVTLMDEEGDVIRD